MTSAAPRQPLPDGVTLSRPKLRSAIRFERGKLVFLTVLAVLATLLFGFCCSGAWTAQPSVVSMSIIIQLSLIGLPWWWLVFRSTHYSFRHDLDNGLAPYGEQSQLIDVIDGELRDALAWYRGYGASDTAGLTCENPAGTSGPSPPTSAPRSTPRLGQACWLVTRSPS